MHIILSIDLQIQSRVWKTKQITDELEERMPQDATCNILKD